MRNKGFTLIELLAVIVILAIIALIATPIVINMIGNAKDSSDERSAENYLTAVKQGVADFQVKNAQTKVEGKYSVMKNGNLCNNLKNDNTCAGIEIPVQLEGKKIMPSKIVFSSKGNIESVSGLVINDKKYLYKNGSIKPFSGLLCELQNGDSKKLGAKYVCHLDDDRIFYVYDSNDKTVKLIMRENFVDNVVPETMSWCDPNGSNPSDSSCYHDGLDPYIEYIQKEFGNSAQVLIPEIYYVNRLAYDVDIPDGKDWLFSTTSSDGTNLRYWTSTINSDFSDSVWTSGGHDSVNLTTDVGFRPIIAISSSLLN